MHFRLLVLIFAISLQPILGFGQYKEVWKVSGDLRGTPRCMIKTKDGNIVVAGSKPIVIPNPDKPVIVEKPVKKDDPYSTPPESADTAVAATPAADEEELPENINTDLWIAKFSTDGKLLWEKTYGGKEADVANGIIQTYDGGLAVAGTTASRGKGKADAWILKLDADANIIWDTVYGGKKNDGAYAIIETYDHGLAIAGFTESKGKGNADSWLIRLDAKGKKKWDITDGGGKRDVAYSLVEGPDKYIIMAGYSYSAYGYGGKDYFLVRVDTMGQIKWDKVKGGNRDDVAYNISLTSDNNFTIFGMSDSKKTYPCGWMVKMTPDGKRWGDEHMVPNGTLHMCDPIECRAISECADKCLLITGKGFVFQRQNDAIVVKLGPDGEMQQYMSGGTEDEDNGIAAMEMPDGSIIMVGTSAKDTFLMIKFKR